MSKREEILELGRQGVAVVEIARKLGVRYQSVRQALIGAGIPRLRKDGTMLVASDGTTARKSSSEKSVKPDLKTAQLEESGFNLVGDWIIDDNDRPIPTIAIPKHVGVYAFSVDGIVQYVGVATMGLAKRLYFYGKPGQSQKTSQRINGYLLQLINAGVRVQIHVAHHPVGPEAVSVLRQSLGAGPAA